MTIEEAIKILKYPVYKWTMDWDERDDGLSYTEAIEMAISALCELLKKDADAAVAHSHSEIQAKESIKVLTAMLSTHQWEPVRAELEFAINEVKKCIPAKPIRERWTPNRCPNCNANLGGGCDDG